MRFFKRKKRKRVVEKKGINDQFNTHRTGLFSPPNEKGYKGSGGGP
jgi:hypothetical protein